MRLLMLSWEFPPLGVGGLSQHVFEISRALAAEGCRVEVITAGGEDLPEKELMNGVKVWRVSPYHAGKERGFIDWVQRLNFALLEKGAMLCNRGGRFDLVHAHDWLVAYAARALKHIYTMPLLLTMHATEFGRNSGLHNDEQRYISGIEWWLAYEAWKVICCSGYMREELHRAFQLPEEKVVVVANGIRPEAFETAGGVSSLPEHLLNSGDKIIFYVGRLVVEKGVQVLLEAAPYVLRRFPEAKFVIAGTGPYGEHLKEKSVELGLGDRVYFCGYIDDGTRNELYRLASAAVFPSLYEPFGIVALEAMVSGAPVIVSACGGLDEIVEHEVDGLKVPPGDAARLAREITRLLADENAAASLADKGYSKAVKNYSWKAVASQTAGIYREIVFSPDNKKWQDTAGDTHPLQKAVEQKGGAGPPL